MKTLKEKIEVMQAAEAGEEIEFRYADTERDWAYVDAVWNWSEYDYRIKPEPMEFWVNVYEGGDIHIHGSLESAKGCSGTDTHKTIKVREVIE